MASFNLVTEPWIPVMDTDGRVHTVGLRDALAEAHRWVRLCRLPPLAEAAVFRLLVAVMRRALGGPKSEEGAVRLCRKAISGTLRHDKKVDQYLERYYHRFDLYSDRYPFYQVPDMPLAFKKASFYQASLVKPPHGPRPWTCLVEWMSSGNNPMYFDRTMDSNPPPASPAQAAIALITHQAFALGGLMNRYGLTSARAAPLAKGAVYMPQGNNLLETLLLNMLPQYHHDRDRPIWERPHLSFNDLLGCGGRAFPNPCGQASLYTWLPRSVLLLPGTDGTVREIDYGPGMELSDPDGVLPVDPMRAQRVTSKGLQELRLSPEKACWRDLEALLPAGGHQPVGVLGHAGVLLMRGAGKSAVLFPVVVVGMVVEGGAQAKAADIRREVFPLSPRVIDHKETDPGLVHRVRADLRLAEKVAESLRLAVRMAAAGISGDRNPKRIARLEQSISWHLVYWGHLGARFSEYMGRIASNDEPSKFWAREVMCAAWSAWASAREGLGRNLQAMVAAARAELEVTRAIRRLKEEYGV